MTLFTTSRPTISVKSVTRYPTRITTGTGLSYTYDNGTLNISLDYSDIPDSAAIADPANYTTVVYNKTTGALEEVQLDYIPTTVVTDPVYTRGDSNFTIPNDYRVLSLVANLTASRTWTLPSAEDVTSGNRIFIYDTAGGISAAYPLVIAAPSGDTINGASSITLSNAFAGITIVSNGGTQWTAILTNVDSVGGLGTNVANALKSAVNSANGVIRLDSSGNVPALNGAALTSLNASNLGSGTVPAARLPGPSLSTIGGVKAKAAETSKFVNQIDTDGSVNLAQPAFSDISGSVAASQLPNPSASTLGGVQSKASESNKFLTAIGTDGTVSNAQPSFSNISGSVAASQLPNPSASTLGGVQSKAAASNQFLTQIGTDGSVSSAQPAVGDISGFGTGVGTALGVNVGSSGAFVTNGGALGTPSSGTLTNATGLPISTGVSGLGTGVATFLATPSSANLASAVTDETGTGALVFANSPTLVTPALGTPSSGTLTNCTGLPAAGVTGLGSLATLSSINNSNWSGTQQSVANGGTGLTSLTAGYIPYGNGTGAFSSGALIVDASGNLGLGVSPSAWLSSFKSLQIGNGAAISGRTNTASQVYWTSNAYIDSGATWRYLTSDYALRHYHDSGKYIWDIAGSGTAGSAISFTQAMTLTSGGRLGIGQTSPDTLLHINTVSAAYALTIEASSVTSRKYQLGMDSSGGLSFYDTAAASVRMVLDSSGDVTIANLAGVGSRAVNADANGVLSAASDMSLKREVISEPLPGLNEIIQLQPRAYQWLSEIERIGNNAAVEVGFFANEVAPIIPSAAPKGVDGLYGFYDRSVTAALVNAVKELAAKVSALEAKQ